MAGKVYIEENGVYKIDFRAAINSSGILNRIFNRTVTSILSDVDVVAETKDAIILIEYKNANILGAVHAYAFKPEEDKKIIKIARKFYDSTIFIWACGYDKPLKYVYILEYPLGDSTTRKMIRNRIATRLPFNLQKCKKIKRQLISSFEVLSIKEWNDDPLYSRFPISRV